MRCATSAVLVAGLATTGIPASSAHAAFSPRPHAGKLKALTCTATPSRGTYTCCPKRRALRPSCVAVAVDEHVRVARAPARGPRRPRACRWRRRRRTSRRCACCRRSAIARPSSSSRFAWMALRHRAEQLAALPRTSSPRRAGPPRSRAKASAAPKSMPSVDAVRERLFRRRVDQRRRPPLARDPPTAHVARELLHRYRLLLVGFARSHGASTTRVGRLVERRARRVDDVIGRERTAACACARSAFSSPIALARLRMGRDVALAKTRSQWSCGFAP